MQQQLRMMNELCETPEMRQLLRSQSVHRMYNAMLGKVADGPQGLFDIMMSFQRLMSKLGKQQDQPGFDIENAIASVADELNGKKPQNDDSKIDELD